MTKENAMLHLMDRAGMIEYGRQLDERANGIFCGCGGDREIHLTQEGFRQVSEALQAITTFNPNWSERYNKTEAYFFTELLGKEYKVFALLSKGVQE